MQDPPGIVGLASRLAKSGRTAMESSMRRGKPTTSATPSEYRLFQGNFNMNKESHYQVSVTPGKLVRVFQKASYLNCGPLRSFFEESMLSGRRNYIVDFQDCSSMGQHFFGHPRRAGPEVTEIRRRRLPHARKSKGEETWKPFKIWAFTKLPKSVPKKRHPIFMDWTS